MSDQGWLIDDSFEAYTKFKDSAPVDTSLNEDTTRLRLIDTVLFDVLRWDRNQVNTEEYVRNTGFADYVFHTRGGRSLVLEAKRVGTTFAFSGQSYPDRAVPFTLIAEQCRDAYEAMLQAVQYANSLGIRYTAISNGRQWLLMLTHVEGRLLKERKVLVFESLDAIRERFPLFWGTFSPVSISTNKPYGLLVDIRTQPAPAKLSASIPNYPVPRTSAELRNKHATSLQYVWDEINNAEGTRSFFDECYVPPLSHEKNQNLAKALLVHRSQADAQVFEQIPASTATGELFSAQQPEKPIVLLGRIGHGKSTFIKYLKTVAAPEQLSRYLQIDIDFLDLPRRADDVAPYVHGQIAQQLLERYSVDIYEDKFVRAALSGPLQRFRKSPTGAAYANSPEKYLDAEIEFIESLTADKHQYLTRAVQHLKGGRMHSVAFFFDNLDKRPDPIQEEAFVIASAMARDWAAMVFICLRPGTFYRSREAGVLDSISPRIIQVHSPPVSVFLKRRLAYAKGVADGSKAPPRGDTRTLNSTIAADAEQVAQLYSVFADSVQSNRDLCLLFESVSNGNLRFVLGYFGSVITSGHLNTVEILDAIDRTGGYTIAHHQALRAILYGDVKHFDPRRQPFVNLFDIEHADPLEHFALPTCLYHLTQAASDTASHGLLRYEDLTAQMTAYTFTPQLIESATSLLFAKKCIEDDRFSDDWAGNSGFLRITALGRYHIADLITRFQYLDAVAVDTPVVDDTARQQVRIVDTLPDRLRRARVLLAYLHRSAQAIIGSAFYGYWDRVHQHLANDMTDIETRSSGGSFDSQ